MKISSKLLFIIVLLILTIISGCNEEIGSDDIKAGWNKPTLNYFYAFQPGYSYPTNRLFLDAYHVFGSDSYSVTAMEWNTTFLIESSFPLSDIIIESTESWLTCKRLEGATFILTVATYNTPYTNSFGYREGHVYIYPANRLLQDQDDYTIDIEVHQHGRDIVLFEDGKWLSTNDQTISFSENGGTSKTYEVRADGEYTITKGATDSWYTVTHLKENNTFYVTTTANPTSTKRAGVITIALAGLPSGKRLEVELKVLQDCKVRNLTVFQNGIKIIDGHIINFSKNGASSSTYEIKADGAYSITKGTNDSWYSVTHSKENNTFFVNVTENTTSDTREGSIIIALDGLPVGESNEIKLRIIQSSSLGVMIDDTYGQDEKWDL